MEQEKKTLILSKDSSPTELMLRLRKAQLIKLQKEIKELEEKLQKECFKS